MSSMRLISRKSLKLLDLALVLLSFGFATTLIVDAQKEISLSQFLSMRLRVSNFLIFLAALLFCHIIFSAFHLYRFRRLADRRKEILEIFKATTVIIGGLVVLGSVFSIRMFTPLFFATFWTISSAALCISRYFVWKLLAKMRRRDHNLRHVLILGTNARAIDFARRLVAAPELGYRLVGFVDQDWSGLPDFETTEFRRVSDCADLKEFLRRNVVDEVAIYLPLGSFYKHASEVACLCEQHGIAMRFHSDIFGLKSARPRADVLNGDQYIATQSIEDQEWHFVAKRLLDIVLSTILLTLSVPLLLGIAAVIKIDSCGPVFFFQERIGVNKRRFRMIKFRTMVNDAERLLANLETQNEVAGPVFKMRNDPRITSVGRFLRKSSLDELPQLLNVLRGDMSLVGPRPLPVRDYEGFNEDWQRRRFSVRPGITCLWQVGGRSNTSFEQWMLLDLQYMDEWSLWLDLKILAKTVPAVLKGAGAA